MTLTKKILKSRVFSLFNSFSIDTFLVLFAAILLWKLDTVLSKFVFATKFTCFNPALKTAATLLNSGVVIYLSWLWLLSLFSVSVILVL